MLPPENFEKMDSKLCILEPFFCIKNLKRRHTSEGPGACSHRKILKNGLSIVHLEPFFALKTS